MIPKYLMIDNWDNLSLKEKIEILEFEPEGCCRVAK